MLGGVLAAPGALCFVVCDVMDNRFQQAILLLGGLCVWVCVYNALYVGQDRLSCFFRGFARQFRDLDFERFLTGLKGLFAGHVFGGGIDSHFDKLLCAGDLHCDSVELLSERGDFV